jgi:hypothetical protein
MGTVNQLAIFGGQLVLVVVDEAVSLRLEAIPLPATSATAIPKKS